MDFKHLVVFLSKVLCDATSRLAILGMLKVLDIIKVIFFTSGAWVYTINSGNFNTLLTVGFYYTLATINFIENLAFSIHKNEDIVSFRNLTGVQASGKKSFLQFLFFRNSVKQCPQHLDF